MVAVRGTSLGPVLAPKTVQLWEKHASIGGITDVLNDAFKAGIGRAAVQGAPAAAGVALQAARDEIAESLGGAPSRSGAKMFSSRMTCMLTWGKRSLNVSDMLLKALRGT